MRQLRPPRCLPLLQCRHAWVAVLHAIALAGAPGCKPRTFNNAVIKAEAAPESPAPSADLVSATLTLPASSLGGAALGDGRIVAGDVQGMVHWIRDGVIEMSFDTTKLPKESGKKTNTNSNAGPISAMQRPLVLEDGQTVVIGTARGTVHWLRNGNSLAHFEYGTPGFVASKPTPASKDGALTAVMFRQGGGDSDYAELVWFAGGVETSRRRINEIVVGDPITLGDGRTISVVTADGRVHLFMDGKLQVAPLPLHTRVASSPVLGPDGELVVAGASGEKWIEEGKLVASGPASPQGTGDHLGGSAKLRATHVVALKDGGQAQLLSNGKLAYSTANAALGQADTGLGSAFAFGAIKLADEKFIVVGDDLGKLQWIELDRWTAPRNDTKSGEKATTPLKISWLNFRNGDLHVRYGVGDSAQGSENTVGDILYFHGFADRLDNHGPLFDAWRAAGFRVLAFDFPSHGETYGKRNRLDQYSFEDLSLIAAEVEKTTRESASRPLLLAGWSTGGLAAVRSVQKKSIENATGRNVSALILFAPGISVHPLVGEFGLVTTKTLTHNRNPPHQGPINPRSPLLTPVFSAKLLQNALLARENPLPKSVPMLTLLAGETEDKYVRSLNVKDWALETRLKFGVKSHGYLCENARHELDNEPRPVGEFIRMEAVNFALQAVGKPPGNTNTPPTCKRF